MRLGLHLGLGLAQQGAGPVPETVTAQVGSSPLLIFAETGLAPADPSPVTTDTKRMKLTETGYAFVSSASDPRTAFNGSTYIGNIMQAAGTYPVAPAFDDTSASTGDGDPRRVTVSGGSDTAALPGTHSATSIFQGTGKGVVCVRVGTGEARFRVINGKLTGLSSGQVVRQASVFEIVTSQAGTIVARAYGGLTTTVSFTHDAQGRITGHNGAWASQRVDFFNYPFLINGRQYVALFVDRVTTGSGDIDFGLDIAAGTGASGLNIMSATAQVSPDDWPTAVPVVRTGSYAADAVDTGVSSQAGFELHGTAICRSRVPSGVISPVLASGFNVGGAWLPICTRIDMIDTTEVANDRAGFLPNPQVLVARRPWRSPEALNISYGACRIGRQFVDVDSSNEFVTDVKVSSVFEGRVDKLAILGNTATSSTFLLGDFDVSGNILLGQGDAGISAYFQQTSIRAGNGRTFDLRATTDIIAENCLVVGSSHWPTRARHQVQRDEGNEGRVWIGEFGLQTSGGPSNEGATIKLNGTRTHRLARTSWGGVAANTQFALEYNDFCATEPWMDAIYGSQGVVTSRSALRVSILKCTARMDTSLVQSERAIRISKDGGETWANLNLSTDPIASLPHGINAAKVGTFNFETSTFTSDPDPSRLWPIRFYDFPSASNPVRSNPGFQFIASQMDLGTHNQFPVSGEVFRWIDPENTDYQLEFTAQHGRWRDVGGVLTYERLGSGVLPILAVTESPDGEQWNRFGITAVGEVGDYDAKDWFVISRGTMQFITGGSWNIASAPPRDEPPANGSAYDNFVTERVVYVADRKPDFYAFDWSRTDPARATLTDVLAVQAANGYTLPSGSGLYLGGGTAGYHQEVTIDNVHVLTGAGNAFVAQDSATVIGAGVLIPARFRRNFNEFDPLPEGSAAPDYLLPERYDETQGCAIMPATLGDAWDFRFPGSLATTLGWNPNAMIVTAIGDHRRWDDVIADIEAKYHQTPHSVVRIDWNTPVGTVLATGVSGNLAHHYSGNLIDELFAIVGTELHVAKSLVGLNRIDVLLTSTRQLLVVDIVEPDAEAPTLTGLTVTGTPQDGQTLSFAFTTTGFPTPTVTGTVFVFDPLTERFTEIDTFSATTSSASYVLDFINQGISASEILIFRLQATNSGGSASSDISVTLEESPVADDGFVGIRAVNQTGGTTISVAVPVGTAAGDTLVAYAIGGTGNEHAAPAGWTRVQNAGGHTLHHLNNWDGTTTSYDFVTPGATDHGVLIMAYREYVFGTSSAFTSPVANPTPAAITPPVADSILVTVAGVATATSHTYSMPSGWTAIGSNTGNRQLVAFERDTLAPASSQAGETVTRLTGSSNSRALQFSLSPEI